MALGVTISVGSLCCVADSAGIMCVSVQFVVDAESLDGVDKTDQWLGVSVASQATDHGLAMVSSFDGHNLLAIVVPCRDGTLLLKVFCGVLISFLGALNAWVYP